MITFILLASLAICIGGLIYCLWEIRECNIRLKRNEAVFNFRCHILYAHYDLFDKLPDYDSMLEDGKSLTIESYFPEYKNNKT